MQTKQTESLDLKVIQPDGTFTGILSKYNAVDQGGDLIEPGSYRKTIADMGTTRPLLWQHQTDQPIGVLELLDRADGLWVKGQILIDIPMGKTAYSLIKNKIISGLSIGYQAIREDVVKGVRHLKEIKLFEGSIVTFPMDPAAQITSVKSSNEFDANAFRKAFANALIEFKTDILKSLDTSTKGRH